MNLMRKSVFKVFGVIVLIDFIEPFGKNRIAATKI